VFRHGSNIVECRLPSPKWERHFAWFNDTFPALNNFRSKPAVMVHAESYWKLSGGGWESFIVMKTPKR
jgi:hypothetical protein